MKKKSNFPDGELPRVYMQEKIEVNNTEDT